MCRCNWKYCNYFRNHGWRKIQPVAVRVKFDGLRFDRLSHWIYPYILPEIQLDGIEPREEFNYHGKVSLIKLEKDKL